MWKRDYTEHLRSSQVPWFESGLVARGLTPGTQLRTLSVDRADGASTCIWRIPPRWRHEARFRLAAHEQLFVLEGSLRKGETNYERHAYAFQPAGSLHGAMSGVEGAVVLAMWDGELDLASAAGANADAPNVLHTDHMDWQPTIAEGPDAGIMVKVLRRAPATGEMTFIVGILPNWRESRSEHHDCVEESFKLSGDMEIYEAGSTRILEAGDYFWRPPYVEHGPMLSRTGTMSLIRVSSTLVNHYSPVRGVEQPTSAAALEQAPSALIASECKQRQN